MREIDAFERIIQEFGLPEQSQSILPETLARLSTRVPRELADFWKLYGWGMYKDRYFRLCNPEMFDPLIAYIFKDDPDFDPLDMSVIGYTAFNTLRIWNKKTGSMLAFMEKSEISGGIKAKNPNARTQYPDAFLSGLHIYDALRSRTPRLYNDACARLGKPGYDEVFGYAPALQIGGEWGVAHLHRFKAVEHMTFLAQLGPLILTELTTPNTDSPMGRMRNVRYIGRQ
ncbi:MULTISPECIES: GAD-like domain-containing protein [Methylobacterium]|jgi:hypothetical protein|uniref:GAD-like domain-containing protein n=1 Tax=Methylobacterium TaxID=407 RepID=UPI000B8423F5|nr:MULTISPECIES: GAD-like domain-containing protein [Methylobacterium]MBK3398267.1 DUF1851 domain-containing protein [Methylobacterium ajmalii]MBK3410029.1 DUF1851 domain-containing protein [Methylobacterium ajmalii]MBK3421641.1 DUF1851 domain-containing protein [Methylobacterium ajmalii]MBZ6416060.1 DUF1851 domain-containing protein [Methylobacterium sp.]